MFVYVHVLKYLFLLGGGGVSRLSFGTPSEAARCFKHSEGQQGSKNICMGARFLWPPAKTLPGGVGLILAFFSALL